MADGDQNKRESKKDLYYILVYRIKLKSYKQIIINNKPNLTVVKNLSYNYYTYPAHITLIILCPFRYISYTANKEK